MHKVQDKQIALHRRITQLEETETNLCRRPSLLDLPAASRRRHGQFSRPNSRAGCSDTDGFEVSALHWDATDIDSWLEEVGMIEYSSLFKQQSITTGRRLLSLTEEHLKEMSIVIGHRVELLFHIDKLRKGAGWVSRAAYADIPALFDQLVFLITCKYFKFNLGLI